MAYFIDPLDSTVVNGNPEQPATTFITVPWDGGIVPARRHLVDGASSSTASTPEGIEPFTYEVDPFISDLDTDIAKLGIRNIHIDEEGALADHDAMENAVRFATNECLERGSLPVVVGGDHSASIGALKSAFDSGIRQFYFFDAHADLREEWDGNRNSHACVTARLLEYAKVRGEMVKIAFFGVRAISRAEYNQIANSEHLETIGTHYGVPFPQEWHPTAPHDSRVWVEVDIDVLDAPYCPHTGHPVPGGPNLRQVEMVLREISWRNKIAGMSLMEVGYAPYDMRVAAHLLCRMVAIAHARKGNIVPAGKGIPMRPSPLEEP